MVFGIFKIAHLLLPNWQANHSQMNSTIWIDNEGKMNPKYTWNFEGFLRTFQNFCIKNHVGGELDEKFLFSFVGFFKLILLLFTFCVNAQLCETVKKRKPYEKIYILGRFVWFFGSILTSPNISPIDLCSDLTNILGNVGWKKVMSF